MEDGMRFGLGSENGRGLPHLGAGLEHKFARFDEGLVVEGGTEISGYASLFGRVDQGGDLVARGAYGASLAAAQAAGRRIKMLWQHDPAQPIGVWVKGRLLDSVARGREAAALIEAGAIDGLSIGYRTQRAAKNDAGQRVLQTLDLWEVSLVTFPMLPTARIAAKGDFIAIGDVLRGMAGVFDEARRNLKRNGG